MKLDAQQMKILKENLSLKLKMAASKKIKSGKWATTETNLFVEVLADEEFQFGKCFKKGAIKRLTNEKLNREILKIFTAVLAEKEFIEINQQPFLKDGYEMLILDTKS